MHKGTACKHRGGRDSNDPGLAEGGARRRLQCANAEDSVSSPMKRWTRCSMTSDHPKKICEFSLTDS